MKKRIKSPEVFRIREKVSFSFSDIRNAQAVALALCAGGFFVTMSSSSSGYRVSVNVRVP